MKGFHLTNKPEHLRARKIIQRLIAELEIDLSGLTVFTEAASGAYLYTPIMAAMAGAEKVYAIAKESSYGTIDHIKDMTHDAASLCEVSNKIDIVTEKTSETIGESDIITNSGFVRPIDKDVIKWMKPTAVLPLMWETWEFRDDDLDLNACKEKGILVLGTDETTGPINMSPYAIHLGLKLLYHMKIEGHLLKVLLLGGTEFVRHMAEGLRVLGADVTWFSTSDAGSLPYSKLQEHFQQDGAMYDAMIVMEHMNPIRLVGSDGLITVEDIEQINPALRIGVISGNIHAEELKTSELFFFPKHIKPFGYMSYQPYDLGAMPVLHLYGGGLKVGEVMARARLKGLSPSDAATYALENSPAMDFKGKHAWIQMK